MTKKDGVSAEVPKSSEKPVSNVRNYFTKEVNGLIADMTVKEMESLMKDLATTRHWIAMLKYTSMRTPLLNAQLQSVNPTNDPHGISWAQGAMAGLCDIESYVIDLNTPTPVQEGDDEQSGEVKPEGVIIG